MLKEKPVQRTRRQWRRNRPTLTVGQTGVEGEVKRFYPEKKYGFIQPKNKAAWIRFYLSDVPYTRLKCVAVGRRVYFTVAEGSEGDLKALII